MKTRGFIVTAFVCASCLSQTACTEPDARTLANSPVIAERISLPTGELIACDLTKAASDTLELPLSALIEDLKYVILDKSEEALIGGGRVSLSDNYILISNQKQVPYKLFNKMGEFLCSIGAYGQGPNEYRNTYHEQLDEKHNRIYILPWMAEKILVFDLKGNPQPSIPLNTFVGKGKFLVNGDKQEVTVTKLPFEGSEEFVWVQDFAGNRKQVIEPGHLMAPRDFSNEVENKFNTAEYDVNLSLIVPTRKDTLYHYNQKENRLEPRFTVTFKDDKIPWHGYIELPDYFLGDVSFPVQVAEGMWQGTKPALYAVNKKTLQGSYVILTNDYFGLKDIWQSFGGGYYAANYDPLSLKERLDAVLKANEIGDAERTAVSILLQSLNEDSNNVIVYGKLKGSL